MSYDIPSVSELEAVQLLNKHYAEVITSKEGGVSSAADITQTTNPITGVTRRTLYKILDDMDVEHDNQMQSFESDFDSRLAGMAFTRVGTFTSGATLTDMRQTLLWEVSQGGDGHEYGWTGAFPKVVPAGSTPATSGGIGAGAWVDRIDATLRSELASSEGVALLGFGASTLHGALGNNLLKFGAVADYAGTPLYDGNDSTRITATDNSPALLNAITNGNVVDDTLVLYVPAGHYGFKTMLPALTPASVGASKIVIRGDGLGISVLDFIYEDTSNTSYVWYYDANTLLRLQGFDEVIFKDVTTKCTTKHGPVNGSTSPLQSDESAYYGAVWFSSCEGNSVVTFESVEATRGNYNCNSVRGTRDDVNGHRGELNIINCEGHHNTSVGFAGQFLAKMTVNSGVYYRNGTRGITSVGYGVKAESGVTEFKVCGGVYFENYRKGVDRHSGCGLMHVKGSTFIDNLLYDVYDNNWYADIYYPGGDLNRTILEDCTHLVNVNEKWLSDAMSAVKSGSLDKHFWAINDHINPSGTQASRNVYALVKNPTVKVCGSLPVQYNQLTLFLASALTSETINPKIDLYGLSADNNSVTPDVYTKRYFINEYPSSSTEINSGEIKIPDASANNKNTALFILYGTGKLKIKNNDFDIHNLLIKYSTSAGDAVIWSGDVDASENTFVFRDLKLTSFGGGSYTNAVFYLNHPFMLQSSILGRENRNRIGFGNAENIVDWFQSTYVNDIKTGVLPSSNKSAGATHKIITPVVGGNINFTFNGRGGIPNDVLNVSYLFSVLTKTVHTASAYIDTSAMSNYVVQWNGAPTNFTFKQITLTYTNAQPSFAGFYKYEISCQAVGTPPLLSVV